MYEDEVSLQLQVRYYLLFLCLIVTKLDGIFATNIFSSFYQLTMMYIVTQARMPLTNIKAYGEIRIYG